MGEARDARSGSSPREGKIAVGDLAQAMGRDAERNRAAQPGFVGGVRPEIVNGCAHLVHRHGASDRLHELAVRRE